MTGTVTGDMAVWLAGVLDDVAARAAAAAGTVPGALPVWEFHVGTLYGLSAPLPEPSRAGVSSPPIRSGFVASFGADDPGRHAAAWSPAVVLAQVDADRALLRWLCSVVAVVRDDGEPFVAEHTLALLAARWAHLPGYRPEWRQEVP